MVEKLIRDGKVAVIYSPGNGSGWSTWAHDKDQRASMIFDPGLVALVLEGADGSRIERYCIGRWPDPADESECAVYLGTNIRKLQVEWVPVGAKFRISEYDGSETIVRDDHDDWHVA